MRSHGLVFSWCKTSFTGFAGAVLIYMGWWSACIYLSVYFSSKSAHDAFNFPFLTRSNSASYSGWERRSSPFCVVSLVNEPVGKCIVHGAERLHSEVIYPSMMGELPKASECRIRPATENISETWLLKHNESICAVGEVLDRDTEISFCIWLSSTYRDGDERATCRGF